MNYNDTILENKAFNFFKQLMYNIALAICIMLVGVLILVYGFKFGLYEILSDSQAPYFTTGDMVVVKPQDNYSVGEIIKFDETSNGSLPTTHRLIYIHEENGTTYYICHGDNVQNVDGTYDNNSDWRDDSAYVEKLIKEDGMTISYLKNQFTYHNLIQVVTLNQIEGEVVGYINNYGTYFAFIKEHYMLFIALVAGIWCISSVVQNELDMKKSRRLL